MLSSVVREEVRGAAIGDCETVEMCVPVKEVTPVVVEFVIRTHDVSTK